MRAHIFFLFFSLFHPQNEINSAVKIYDYDDETNVANKPSQPSTKPYQQAIMHFKLSMSVCMVDAKAKLMEIVNGRIQTQSHTEISINK